MTPEKPCRNCGAPFTPSREWSEYCSSRCGSQWRNRKKANYSLKLAGPRVALIARLVVRADIERRGFETYEGAGGVVAQWPDGGLCTVAVRVGRRVAGELKYSEPEKPFDFMAVVVFSDEGQEIIYTPEAITHAQR